LSVMTDYIWNEENRNIIAKLVPPEDIEPGQRARLEPQDICAYREDGAAYTGNHTENTPTLIPKVGPLGKLMRKKPIKRDHLFVHKGPHKVELDIIGSWNTGKMQDITAKMEVRISSSDVGRLFDLADRSDGNEITSDDLAKEVKEKVEGTFAETVMKLSDEPTTKEEFKTLQDEFDQIVDEEFRKLGVQLFKGVLRYTDDLGAKVDHISKGKQAKRRREDEESYDAFSEGVQGVETNIKDMATEGAMSSEGAKKAAGRLEKAIVSGGEEVSRAELDERLLEKQHAAEKRKIARQRELMKDTSDSFRNLTEKKSEEDE